MPRNPDVPCAGCGKLLWSATTSLPAGQRRCRDCRRTNPAGKSARTCLCGKKFRTTNPAVKTCSRECGRVLRATQESACDDCGVMHNRGSNETGSFCVTCALVRRRAHWRRKNAVRRGAPYTGPRLTIVQLGDRDKWRCHLCGQRVGKSFRSPHPRSATFDHLIPVSNGGTDDPENLRLAHRHCNIVRGNRGVAQLLLIG